jgi:hypothetical protein
MDHEILVAAGLMAAGIGLAIWLAVIVRRGRSRPYGTCGFSSEDFEKMTMPAHERLARSLAYMHGYPETEWRRFTAMAVSYLIVSRRHS